MNVLFISYTGVLEALGQSQVAPYVLGLARRGHCMSLLSYERDPPSSPSWSVMARRFAGAGVTWSPLSYHKRPRGLSTLYDVAQGIRAALPVIRQGAQLIHARSHVPSLIADIVKSWSGVPYIFDHRGLMAEEYADAGIWPRGGALYRVTTKLERRFLTRAAGVVVLTDRLNRTLPEGSRRVVIPCAVDLQRFVPAEPKQPREFDLVYAGSWGGLYETDSILAFFRAYRRLRTSARLLLLIPPAARPPLPEVGIEIRHARPEEVASLLPRCQAGLSFRRDSPAQIATSPVKVSEYLACGLPVVTNARTGDLDTLLPTTQTGIIVDGTSREMHMVSAAKLIELLADPGVSGRCRKVAMTHFDLETAVGTYDRLYLDTEAGTLVP